MQLCNSPECIYQRPEEGAFTLRDECPIIRLHKGRHVNNGHTPEERI